MNRLEALQIFARIAGLSSFGRATDTLHIPKPSASTAVRQLESAPATRLLHCPTREVRLTQQGGSSCERGKDVPADFGPIQAPASGLRRSIGEGSLSKRAHVFMNRGADVMKPYVDPPNGVDHAL